MPQRRPRTGELLRHSSSFWPFVRGKAGGLMRIQCTTFFVDDEHLNETIAMLGDLRVALVDRRFGPRGMICNESRQGFTDLSGQHRSSDAYSPSRSRKAKSAKSLLTEASRTASRRSCICPASASAIGCSTPVLSGFKRTASASSGTRLRTSGLASPASSGSC